MSKIFIFLAILICNISDVNSNWNIWLKVELSFSCIQFQWEISSYSICLTFVALDQTLLQGEKGFQGIAGVRGDPGDVGLNGLPGLPGLPGEPGEVLPGRKGVPGENGFKGIPGTQAV